VWFCALPFTIVRILMFSMDSERERISVLPMALLEKKYCMAGLELSLSTKASHGIPSLLFEAIELRLKKFRIGQICAHDRMGTTFWTTFLYAIYGLFFKYENPFLLVNAFQPKIIFNNDHPRRIRVRTSSSLDMEKSIDHWVHT